MNIAELIARISEMECDAPPYEKGDTKVFNVQVNIPIEARNKEEAIEMFMEQLQEIYLHIEPCDLTVKEENEQ